MNDLNNLNDSLQIIRMLECSVVLMFIYVAIYVIFMSLYLANI